MRLIVLPWLPSVIRGRRTLAITLAPFVLIRRGFENNRYLLAHEQVHLNQVAAMGWWTFYWNYVFNVAFRQSVEAEAYAKQREVENA